MNGQSNPQNTGHSTGSGSSKISHRRYNSRPSNSYSGGNNGSNTQSKQETSKSDFVGDDKLLFLIAKSIGKKCAVTITSGCRYGGILLSADVSSNNNPTSPLSVVLQNPEILSKPLINEKSNMDNENDLPLKLVIQAKDLIELEVLNVDLNETKRKPLSQVSEIADLGSLQERQTRHKEGSPFKIDSDISSRGPSKERVLQKWIPDTSALEMSLEDESNNFEGWDQFKVNEEKFGVESSYDEHFYTTRINTLAPDFKEKVEKAEQIAKEIEQEGSSNVHILEERGIQVDDSGIDEEDKYSGVDRRGDGIMAALKNASDSKNKNMSSKSSITKNEASEVHNDPAIVSSSVTDSTKGGEKQTQKANEEKLVKSNMKIPDSTSPKSHVSNQNDLFRLNAQSEINSLREFSATFKVPHKMPNDLLPILAKDKIKQDEIVKRQGEQQSKNQKDQESKTFYETRETGTNHSPKAGQNQNSPHQKKAEGNKPAFKLNPKAAAFTPSGKHSQVSPNIPKSSYSRVSNNPSPRFSNPRPFTNGGGSRTGSKYYHQISPAEFFGGPHRVPTGESQKEKAEQFKKSFSILLTTKKKFEDSQSPVLFEKTYQTPPTWNFTVDESYHSLLPSPQASTTAVPMFPGAPMGFVPSPIMGGPGSGYQSYSPLPSNPSDPNFNMSPYNHHQVPAASAAVAAQMQQQQLQAAWMYRQQQIAGAMQMGVPPTPMGMPSPDKLPFAAGGYMMPQANFVKGASPVNSNMMLVGSPYANNRHHMGNHASSNYYQGHGSGGGRRYNHYHLGNASNKRGHHT